MSAIGTPDSDNAPLWVYTVNYPLAYLAERIGGSEVEAVLPVPAGNDPAYWSPDAETVAAYQSADLILLNGAGYAQWVGRVTLPETRLVDTSVGFRDSLLPLDDGPVHTHGPEGEHSHTGYAFTTWLDPTLAIAHAAAIRDALGAARPERRGAFQSAFERLEADLRAVDERWSAVASTLDGEPLLFSHPVYQYLARRFALDAESVHWEPDSAPDEAQWQALDALLADHPARWMIWEAEPLPEVVERLRAAGVESLVYRPNALPPMEADLLEASLEDLAAIDAAVSAAERPSG